MPLATTHLNQRIELLEGVYDDQGQQQLASLLPLYNRLHGPITGIHLVRPELLDLSIYSAYCSHVPVFSLLRNVLWRTGRTHDLVPGGGKGATRLVPLLGALGEIRERLLAILHFSSLSDQLRYATYDELIRTREHALGPDQMPLFAQAQYSQPSFGYIPFRSDSLLGWVQGRDLLSGDPILVPAQLVLMYYRPHPSEEPIGYATTAGLAFHFSRRQAILHGLYEVIERDALNVSWYSTMAPAHVDIDLRDFLREELSVRGARMSTPFVREVHVLLMNLDLPISVFATVAFDRSRRERGFLGGTGASSSRVRALCQALFELGQCQTGFRFDNPFGRMPIYADTDISELVDFFDAPLYYGHSRNLPRVNWFLENQRRQPWASVPTFRFAGELDEFETTVSWLRETRLHPIVFDFGDDSLLPGHITKVFVPQLTQACPPRDPMLGHPRFYELPRALGRASDRLMFSDLNSDPIPFA